MKNKALHRSASVILEKIEIEAFEHARKQINEAYPEEKKKTLSSSDTKLLYFLTRFLDIAEDHMPNYSSSDFIAEALDELKCIEDSIS